MHQSPTIEEYRQQEIWKLYQVFPNGGGSVPEPFDSGQFISLTHWVKRFTDPPVGNTWSGQYSSQAGS